LQVTAHAHFASVIEQVAKAAFFLLYKRRDIDRENTTR
jgi:hypothetical protein